MDRFFEATAFFCPVVPKSVKEIWLKHGGNELVTVDQINESVCDQINSLLA